MWLVVRSPVIPARRLLEIPPSAFGRALSVSGLGRLEQWRVEWAEGGGEWWREVGRPRRCRVRVEEDGGWREGNLRLVRGTLICLGSTTMSITPQTSTHTLRTRMDGARVVAAGLGRGRCRTGNNQRNGSPALVSYGSRDFLHFECD